MTKPTNNMTTPDDSLKPQTPALPSDNGLGEGERMEGKQQPESPTTPLAAPTFKQNTVDRIVNYLMDLGWNNDGNPDVSLYSKVYRANRIDAGSFEAARRMAHALVINNILKSQTEGNDNEGKRDVISPYDWEEDFSHENGKYNNKCGFCGRYFLGHKRRAACRKCSYRYSPPPSIPNDKDETYVPLRFTWATDRIYDNGVWMDHEAVCRLLNEFQAELQHLKEENEALMGQVREAWSVVSKKESQRVIEVDSLRSLLTSQEAVIAVAEEALKESFDFAFGKPAEEISIEAIAVCKKNRAALAKIAELKKQNKELQAPQSQGGDPLI